MKQAYSIPRQSYEKKEIIMTPNSGQMSTLQAGARLPGIPEFRVPAQITSVSKGCQFNEDIVYEQKKFNTQEFKEILGQQRAGERMAYVIKGGRAPRPYVQNHKLKNAALTQGRQRQETARAREQASPRAEASP